MRVEVFGAGSIGMSTAAVLAHDGGHHVRLVDINPRRLVEARDEPHEALSMQLGFDVPEALRGVVMSETALFASDAYVIAIGTQDGGSPKMDGLFRLVGQIATTNPQALIVIESSVQIGTVDALTLHHPGLRIVVAPRRDTFNGMRDQGMYGQPRIVGYTDRVSIEDVKDLWPKIEWHRASSVQVAELVKPLENALLTAPVVLLQSLAVAYPHLDVREATALAGSHARLPKYTLDIGVSGYCLPVAPAYLPQTEMLMELTESMNWIDGTLRDFIARHRTVFIGARFKKEEPSFAMSHVYRLNRQSPVYDRVLGREGVERLGYEWTVPGDLGWDSANLFVLSTNDPVDVVVPQGAHVLDPYGWWTGGGDRRVVGAPGWLTCDH